MNICTSSNSKYTRYLYVMLTSLFENNRDDSVTVFVLTCDLTQEDRSSLLKLAEQYRQSIRFIDIDRGAFSHLPMNAKMSLETYFRLKLPELLPNEIDRILYLDVDIIVQGALREFYQLPMNGCSFAACHEFDTPELDVFRRELFHRTDHLDYFNAGVMLWDMDRVRRHYSFDDFMKAAAELGDNLPFCDQEILNYRSGGDVLFLDGRKYNYLAQRYSYVSDQPYADSALIIHYASTNPWQLGWQSDLYVRWWDYAKKTPYYVELLEEHLKQSIQASGDFAVRKSWDMAKIYETYYKLKGGKQTKAHLDGGLPYALYGAGRMADALWEFLKGEGVSNLPIAVMDANLEGREFHGIPIRNNFDWAEQAGPCRLVITPAGMAPNLEKELARRAPENVQILSLRSFLNEIG